jgi:hypothetical protein
MSTSLISEGPADHPSAAAGHPTHKSIWLLVMCLTGVDYFSTLGYQPSIAFNNAGLLSPIATAVLVLVTLFGAYPVYAYVASRSFSGQGSIAMLEKLVHGWTGKMLVLVLVGFAATDFVITKTLSAADAAEHLIHNPLWKSTPTWLHNQMGVTMFLLVLLGGMFLRGFKEVIGIATTLVAVYLALNLALVLAGLRFLADHPELLGDWWSKVQSGDWKIDHNPLPGGAGPLMAVAASLLIFPKLALGLSGFETGVAVMPLIKGDAADTEELPQGRIRNAKKLLLSAALIMSFFLLASSLLTATLIDPIMLQEFKDPKTKPNVPHAGEAANRALAFLAHGGKSERISTPISPLYGDAFGTAYDVATILILWFAGASAMAGLLSLVPRYLPRYGMAPEWSRAIGPLAVFFTAVNLLVTIVFDASVEAQGAAYATGVLALIVSACIASVIDLYRRREGSRWRRFPWGFGVITAVFAYTFTATIVEKPDGIKIAFCFIVAILVVSMASRAARASELRFSGFDFADETSKFLWDSMKPIELPILVPHRPGGRSLEEKEFSIRAEHHLTPEIPVVFIEAELGDASEFYQRPVLQVTEEGGGRIVVRATRCASIPHVIAAIGLELSKFGKPPEIHFGWSNESPLAASVSFVLFGQGNVPWMVRELIRKFEPNPQFQPRVVVG